MRLNRICATSARSCPRSLSRKRRPRYGQHAERRELPARYVAWRAGLPFVTAAAVHVVGRRLVLLVALIAGLTVESPSATLTGFGSSCVPELSLPTSNGASGSASRQSASTRPGLSASIRSGEGQPAARGYSYDVGVPRLQPDRTVIVLPFMCCLAGCTSSSSPMSSRSDRVEPRRQVAPPGSWLPGTFRRSPTLLPPTGTRRSTPIRSIATLIVFHPDGELRSLRRHQLPRRRPLSAHR